MFVVFDLGETDRLGRGFHAQYTFIKANEKEFIEDGVKDPILTFQSCFYQALAVVAQHPDAYIFTPDDREWSKDSYWQKIE